MQSHEMGERHNSLGLRGDQPEPQKSRSRYNLISYETPSLKSGFTSKRIQKAIAILLDKGWAEEALKVAVEAAKTDPTSWRTQRSLARLRRKLKGTTQSIKGHYEAAIRHHKGDVGLVVELGAYLFSSGAFEMTMY
jgi:Tfp pilus assembly protein PilF